MVEAVKVELTNVTIEILEMINEMRYDIKNSMMIGERNILKGIDFFEKILREINPTSIDENQIEVIEKFVSLKIQRDEDICQSVNPLVHYGLDRCYCVLWSYNRYSKGNARKRVNNVGNMEKTIVED